MARRILSLIFLALLGAQPASASLRPWWEVRGPVVQATHPDLAGYFPIGVFEDANMIGGDKATFELMLRDLKSRGLDTVLFSNNRIARDAPLLEVSDRLGMKVFMLPDYDWYRNWWPDTVPATLDRAKAAARPAVEAFSGHASFAGYLVKDEPFLDDAEKVVLMTQALRELDPEHMVNTTLIGLNRVDPIFQAADFDVMQIDVYPTAPANPPCDLTMNGFAYAQHDFVSYIRSVTRNRPTTAPLWIIMQTHSFDAGIHSLRTPLPTEVRMQQWLALGEGADGLFWFVYSTQQSWIGLVDNAELYPEVTDLTARLLPLRSLFLRTSKVADQFTVKGGTRPYVSTLASADGKSSYVVAVNRDCQSARQLTISSSSVKGALRDVETGRVYDQGEPIEFRPGDGRIFQVVRQSWLPIVRRPS